MYLNEKAWEMQQDNPYVAGQAVREFVKVYAAVKRNYPLEEICVPECMEIYLRSANYSLQQWMAKADPDERRLFLSFMDKRMVYHPDDEYEFVWNEEKLIGAAEAFLNDSLIISICLDSKWKQEFIEGTLYSLYEEDKTVGVVNLFSTEQLNHEIIETVLGRKKIIKLTSVSELWDRREALFPHLKFCPSVEKNILELERAYLNQVIFKLQELENDCRIHGCEKFDPKRLKNATPESKSTLEKYGAEHTFLDENGLAHLASWHIRFTGIPGRIFFDPFYEPGYILICYIGKKLKNITYPT